MMMTMIIIIIITIRRNIPGNHDVKEQHKMAKLGTRHILWEVLTNK